MGIIRHDALDDQTAFASASKTVSFEPPAGANAAIFYWNISAVAGTTPIADCKLQYHDETSDQAIDADVGASGAAFAQQTGASFQALWLNPHSATADTSGNFRGMPLPLAKRMRAVFTFDRISGNETYSYTLSCDWLRL